MVAPVAKWATRTGHRFTDAGDSLSVDVVAWTNQTATGSGGEGDVASVTFTINGTPQTPITSRSRRRPNYNTTVCPNTGTTTMSDIWAFGFDLNAADWPNGTITIDAVATTTAGSTANLPTLKVYNNKTSDTRPGSKRIYVSPTGNNANNGLTTGAPVQSIQYACDLAATSGNLGGAEIVLMPGEHSWALYYFGPDTARYTSDHWWFTIRLQAGASIARPGAITSNGVVSWSGGGADTLFLVPNTGAGHEDNVRVLFLAEDPDCALTRGDLKISTGASTAFVCHHEGGKLSHPFYNASTRRWSVHFVTAAPLLAEHIAAGSAGSGAIEATNVRAVGVANAFIGCSSIIDCRADDWIGILMAATTYAPSTFCINLHVGPQRYNHTVAGLIDCEIDSGVTMEVVNANRLRIQQSAGSDVNPLGDFGNPSESIDLPDLSIYGTELLNSAQWGITVYNGTTPQSGGIGLNVSASGTNGTGPFIEIDWPSHGYGSGFSLAGWRLKTTSKLRNAAGGSSGGDPWAFIDAVHPDVIQVYNPLTDSLFANVRTADTQGTRVWALGPGNMTRCIWVNCGDTSEGQDSSVYPGTLTDCVWLHCTFVSSFGFTPTALAGVNEFRACHFENFSGSVTGVTVDHCSFANPAQAVGTNQRTGSYIDGDPTVDPWHLTPLALEQGGAAGAGIDYDPAYVFASASGNPSHGCWRDVAEDYQVPSTPAVMTGAGPAALTIGHPTGTIQFDALMVGLGPSALSVSAAAGTLAVGVLMAGGGGAALTIAAPVGSMQVIDIGALDPVMTGDGPAAMSVTAPDGSIAAGALMAGSASSVSLTFGAPTGEMAAQSIIVGDGPDALEFTAAEGTIGPGVLLSGTGGDALTFAAPAGTMNTDVAMRGLCGSIGTFSVPAGTLAVESVPTEQPRPRAPVGRRWQEILRRVVRGRPARKWR